MSKLLTRYDIQVNSNKDEMSLDFILNSSDKKVIRGTVWDDDLNNPKRIPNALVQLYQAGKNYNDNPLDIKAIGYAITDASGEFLVGPFDSDTILIFKIFKFWEDINDGNKNISFIISGEDFEEAFVEKDKQPSEITYP